MLRPPLLTRISLQVSDPYATLAALKPSHSFKPLYIMGGLDADQMCEFGKGSHATLGKRM